jgi:serine/threonine protein kinase/tetratricopeptide (TPR) repeat protein
MKRPDLNHREIRVCATCGSKFCPASENEFCPVCMLREALAGGVESGESFSEDPVKLAPQDAPQRFEHYELVRSEDGTPVELGRGAMGVTYKAFDVDLRCMVTLKVISAKYLDNALARLRFLREARAAASVRHPNVACVFHLGKTGSSYFYAMEFVEGETLEKFIKRSGYLEVNVALEIVMQVTAGLVAVHKQNLVHRDIKPSNIMVSLEDGGPVSVKIIDLGLAKSLGEPGTQTAISTPGAFAGTPEYASPEQFAGLPIDIRSDLYSLGVTLWEMLTGRVPFRGAPGEVMHQQQHAPLPLEQLKDVPQPMDVLFEMLLQKDPAKRPQSPAELLRALAPIRGAIKEGRRIAHQSLQKTPPPDSVAVTRTAPARLGPRKISVARLPITGSGVFGREEDIAFLDAAWANQQVNVVTIVAWGGVGKSTLINHWLGRMGAEHYRSAKFVFGWSFYRQGTSGDSASADEFLDAALTWFGDPDPRIGTAWEKGVRLAKLIAHRRTLLVLDGLEPLQNPPGPQEGRLREPSLQALLRELAAFNTGLCVITTRTAVADIADHEGTSALRRELEQLSGDAGAKLLRALGVTGPEAELRGASDEFQGHCLALTLLGSYLTDAYSGDIRRRKEVSGRLAHDVRQGAHARKVMESYQTWFAEGAELSVLRMLGLFDRPVDEKAIRALLKAPAIPGLTESLVGLSVTEWRMIFARLRRARLLAGEDPNNPGQVDTHPLVREFFGEQLRGQLSEAWKEANRRLYHHFRAEAPQLPDTVGQMEPLFLAVICGCQGGLFRDALHEVYIPRIQRGDSSFAAKVLGTGGALLLVLAHFFEHSRWGSFVETAVEGQSLTAEDQLFILIKSGQALTATRGMGSPEAQICYERAESLCYSLNRPLLLYSALAGQWQYSLMTEKLTAAMQIAKRIDSLAQEQKAPAIMIGEACTSLAVTLYFMGDFEAARQCAIRGIQMWRSGNEQSPVESIAASAVGCLVFNALSEWHLGEITSCEATMVEAISLAKESNDMHFLALALCHAAILAHFEGNPDKVERLASDAIELSTRQNFAQWLYAGTVYRNWARCASGHTIEGISRIEDAIRGARLSGWALTLPYSLALRAEALHLADRTSEALETVKEAETLAKRSGERWWCAELYRLRGVFLATLGGNETQIEASFCEAISTAKQQKSISLEKRAIGTCAEYRRQKASGSGRRGFRLPL